MSSAKRTSNKFEIVHTKYSANGTCRKMQGLPTSPAQASRNFPHRPSPTFKGQFLRHSAESSRTCLPEASPSRCKDAAKPPATTIQQKNQYGPAIHLSSLLSWSILPNISTGSTCAFASPSAYLLVRKHLCYEMNHGCLESICSIPIVGKEATQVGFFKSKFFVDTQGLGS